MVASDPEDRTDVIGNRDEPTDTQLLAFAKRFCVAMRRQSEERPRESLRTYIDPDYLAWHRRTEGEVSVETASVGDIHNITLAEDRSTLLCEVDTAAGTREAILLKVVLRQQRLYLTPLLPPDEQTGSITPWALRAQLLSR